MLAAPVERSSTILLMNETVVLRTTGAASMLPYWTIDVDVG